MFSITRLVTSLAMVVHLMVGCCWHHAHAASPADGAANTSCCAHNECGDQPGDPADESHDHSSPGDDQSPCSEGRCVVVEGAATTVDAPWHLPPVAGGDLPEPLISAWRQMRVATRSDHDAVGEPAQTPVTLHQLLRI